MSTAARGHILRALVCPSPNRRRRERLVAIPRAGRLRERLMMNDWLIYGRPAHFVTAVYMPVTDKWRLSRRLGAKSEGTEPGLLGPGDHRRHQ